MPKHAIHNQNRACTTTHYHTYLLIFTYLSLLQLSGQAVLLHLRQKGHHVVRSPLVQDGHHVAREQQVLQRLVAAVQQRCYVCEEEDTGGG